MPVTPVLLLQWEAELESSNWTSASLMECQNFPKESDIDLEMEGVDSTSLEPHEQPGTEIGARYVACWLAVKSIPIMSSDDKGVMNTFGYFRTSKSVRTLSHQRFSRGHGGN